MQTGGEGTHLGVNAPQLAEVTVPPLGPALAGLGAASPYHPQPHPRGLRLRRDRKGFQFNLKSTLLNSISKPGLFWLFSSLTHVSLSLSSWPLSSTVCHPFPSSVPGNLHLHLPGARSAGGRPSELFPLFLAPPALSPGEQLPLPPFPQPRFSSLSLFLPSSSSQSSHNPLLHRPPCP